MIGASRNVANIGNRVLTVLAQHGFPGPIYPVNPRYADINGFACFPSVSAIDALVDLAIVAVRQELVLDVVAECSTSGVGACIIMSAGFGEGGAGTEEVARLRELLRESPMRVCGPNSLGIFCPPRRVAATFSTVTDRRRDLHRVKQGSIAVLSQSGALGFSTMTSLAWAGVGVGVVASSGNSVDLGVADFVEYWLAQPEIGFVAAIVEEIRDADLMRRLGAAVCAAGKPVGVLKLGRSDRGQKASLSHTGAMAGSADVYSGFFSQYGMIEVTDIADLIALGKLFQSRDVRYGPRVAVLTPSGGAGILITDQLSRHGLAQPSPSPRLAAQLAEALPAYSSVLNPIDVTAQATANAEKSGQTHAQEIALAKVIESGEFDVVIAHVPVSARTAPRLDNIAQIAATAAVPVVLFSDLPATEAAITVFDRVGLPWFTEAERMVSALAAAVRWASGSSVGAQSGKRDVTSPAVGGQRGLDPVRLRQVRESLVRARLGVIGEQTVVGPTDAVVAARAIGLPVAVKIASEAVAHKTELGGVRLGLADDDQVLAAATAIQRSAAVAGYHDVPLVVQQMVDGVEALVSFRRDPKFGPVVVLGCGGTGTELLKQFAVRLAPVSEADVHGMLAQVEKLDAQLRGLRGRPAADRSALVDYVAVFSRLAADGWDGIDEVEINPLIVRPVGAGVAAVDILVS